MADNDAARKAAEQAKANQLRGLMQKRGYDKAAASRIANSRRNKGKKK